MFQFHNGSIKSIVKTSDPLCVCKFQFHNGSIKSRCVLRLVLQCLEFQFHNGSIKSDDGDEGLEVVKHVSIPQWFD